MHWPFRKPAQNDRLVIPLPSVVNIGVGILFNCQGHDLPTSSVLRVCADQWLEEHAHDPLRAALKMYINSPMVRLQVVEKSQFPLPSITTLRAFGLDQSAERSLEQTTHGVMISVSDSLSHPRFGLHAAMALAAGIALAFDGLAFDPECGRFIPPAQYRELLPEDGQVRIAKQILMPFSVDERGEGLMTTSGMSKFGLPNLEIRHIQPNMRGPLSQVMHGVAHYLMRETLKQVSQSAETLSSLMLESEFTLTRTDIDLALMRPQQDLDPKIPGNAGIRLSLPPSIDPRIGERFIQLIPPRAVRTSPTVWHNTLLTDLFGSETAVISAQRDSEMLEMARRKSITELPQVKSRFQSGLRVGEILFVKHGFKVSESEREYMWIVVAQWDGQKIVGTLANDPQSIPALRAGQKVEIYEVDVFDWMLQLPDGTSLGGYTSEALLEESRRS